MSSLQNIVDPSLNTEKKNFKLMLFIQNSKKHILNSLIPNKNKK